MILIDNTIPKGKVMDDNDKLIALNQLGELNDYIANDNSVDQLSLNPYMMNDFMYKKIDTTISFTNLLISKTLTP